MTKRMISRPGLGRVVRVVEPALRVTWMSSNQKTGQWLWDGENLKSRCLDEWQWRSRLEEPGNEDR